jgi:hypothetical protein
VDLELSFEDGSVRAFTVSPVQATVVLHVADCGSVRLSRLVALCECDEDELLRGSVLNLT